MRSLRQALLSPALTAATFRIIIRARKGHNMIFGWLRRRRRRKILETPFPDQWRAALEADLWQYACLPDAEQARLRDAVLVMIAEKNWEGCGGLILTDEMRVRIAATACLLILTLAPDSYDHVLSILIYPEDYLAPESTHIEGGLIREGMSNRAGEAWRGGTVVLSWADVLGRGRRRGSNVVIHEFAHQLDMLNHNVDGTPPLADGSQIPRWHRIMVREHDRLVRQVERGERTFLDAYGATDLPEFFAVASEFFFERPGDFRRHLPELYTMFREYYGQDPAEWRSRAAT